jgi:ribosome-binding protein aMBF1 (putative translation factor)
MEHKPKSMDASAASPKSPEQSPNDASAKGAGQAASRESTSSGSAKPAKRASGRARKSQAAEPVVESKNNKNRPLPKRVNRVRTARIDRMMSKAELARRAGLSVLTIDRIEKGLGCRMDTKRKILEALGLSLADRVRVFGEEE